MYVCLKSNLDIYESKWFNLCRIQINGHDVLEYTYELLVHKSKNCNLPPGVLSIPHVDKLNLCADSVVVIFYDLDLPTQSENITISLCAETSNWLTIGELSTLVFAN
jgi:hypothetical protein